jgi:hypothetical protein
VLIDNLISYWCLDESSGNALDIHDSNTFTDNNIVGTDAGKISTARLFNGTDQYFSYPGNLLNGLAEFSVQAWVMNTRESTAFRPDRIFSSYDGAIGDGVELYLDSDPGGARFAFNKPEAYVATPAVSDNPASANAWYHLVGTVSSGGVVTLYVNGTAQATIGTTSGTLGNTSATYIGTAWDLGASSFWQGLIDEVAIWSRELSGAEVIQLYNGFAGFAYPLDPDPPRGGAAVLRLVA